MDRGDRSRRSSFSTVLGPDVAEPMQIGRRFSEELASAISASRMVVPLSQLDSIAPDDSISVMGLRHARDSSSSGVVLPLGSLTPEQVGMLLHAIRLGRYAEGFMQLPLRGADLEEATEDDLTEAGVTIRVHRRTLLKQVEEWSTRGVPAEFVCVRPTSQDEGGPSPGRDAQDEADSSAVPRPADLDGWRPVCTEAGEVYFVNDKTGESVWQLPTQADGGAPPQQAVNTLASSSRLPIFVSVTADDPTVSSPDAAPAASGGSDTMEVVLGHEANKQGDYERARTHFCAAFAQDNSQYTTLVSAANMALKLGEGEDALRDYEVPHFARSIQPDQEDSIPLPLVTGSAPAQ